MSARTAPVAVPASWRQPLAALERLPREARDTLLLLVVIGITVAPHLLKVPAWCVLMVLALLAWRAGLAISARALPGRWAVWVLLLLAGAFTLWSERTLLGRDAGVNLLVVLMALKTMELRARRDALVVFFLGFFLVLTHFLYSQSLLTGMWMLLALWGLLSALVLAHMPVGRPSLARAAGVAARATLLGLPLMAILFVLFPRIGPLWGLPQDAGGRTGLSGTLRMGGVAQIANDDSIAFRVRFAGPRPPERALYFRGPVLATFNGTDWTRLVPNVPAGLRARADLQVRGTPTSYEITLEPSRTTLLPMLEATREAPEVDGGGTPWLMSLRPDLQWQTDRPIDERVRLKALAWLEHSHGPRAAVPGLRDHLQLPAGFNPRMVAWAQALRASPELADADATRLAQALLQTIRAGGFTYTLEPGTYGRDAVDEFWFDRKLGFCEHFAASFVVAMRAMDVPARIVTGYQGADELSQDGWLVVRQSNAHAWAEYWLAGTGWVRIDPTSAVAPERVSAGRSLAPPSGLVAGALSSVAPALAQRLRAAWETLNNSWNQWVLNYSRTQQFDLLRSLGFTAPDWQELAKLLIGVMCTLALAGAGWAWWDRRRQDPWQRLLKRVQEALSALGVAVQPHEAPRTRAAIVRRQLGERGEPLAAELEALDRLRYAGQQAPRAAEMAAWWRRFAASARGARQAGAAAAAAA